MIFTFRINEKNQNLITMKARKANKKKTDSISETANKNVNPFAKLIGDKERIANAVNNNQSLSSLKDIKFVRPI